MRVTHTTTLSNPPADNGNPDELQYDAWIADHGIAPVVTARSSNYTLATNSETGATTEDLVKCSGTMTLTIPTAVGTGRSVKILMDTGTVSVAINGLGSTITITAAGPMLTITDKASGAWDVRYENPSAPLVLGTTTGTAYDGALGAAAATAASNAQNTANAAVPKTTTVNGHALSGNVTVTKSDVGLGNVANTAPADLPISTATQTALDAKVTANTAITASGSTNKLVQYDAKGLVVGGVDATAANVGAVATATLAALGTGLVKNTTGTGAPSIATAADVPAQTEHLYTPAASATCTLDGTYRIHKVAMPSGGGAVGLATDGIGGNGRQDYIHIAQGATASTVSSWFTGWTVTWIGTTGASSPPALPLASKRIKLLFEVTGASSCDVTVLWAET